MECSRKHCCYSERLSRGIGFPEKPNSRTAPRGSHSIPSFSRIRSAIRSSDGCVLEPLSTRTSSTVRSRIDDFSRFGDRVSEPLLTRTSSKGRSRIDDFSRFGDHVLDPLSNRTSSNVRSRIDDFSRFGDRVSEPLSTRTSSKARSRMSEWSRPPRRVVTTP